MKLDPTVMRTMNRQDFSVLAAVESGMMKKNKHALVPSSLIVSIAKLRHGGTSKILSCLLRDKLVSHDCSCGYDGYRLTNAGYDILALHNLKSRSILVALGDCIGTGKESDVYLAVNPNGTQVVLKFHRLGRTSFRNVKKKRDYFTNSSSHHHHSTNQQQHQHQHSSWLFLSRMSAMKEYAFMKALHDVEYPTPQAIAHNRHVVVMSLVQGIPLYQLRTSLLSEQQAKSICQQSITLLLRLAQHHGLVHCDLNEFNLMVDISGGIQSAAAKDNIVGEPYVKHSGMSVTNNNISSKGALSTPTWLLQQQQQQEEYHHHDHHYNNVVVDGTGEIITEVPVLEPIERRTMNKNTTILSWISMNRCWSHKVE